jgi:hypothetical protein
MNPYESPQTPEPIQPPERPPLPEDELPIFAGKLFRYLGIAAVIGLIGFLAMLAWAILSIAPPD